MIEENDQHTVFKELVSLRVLVFPYLFSRATVTDWLA